jgi:hypothetical protein
MPLNKVGRRYAERLLQTDLEEVRRRQQARSIEVGGRFFQKEHDSLGYVY